MTETEVEEVEGTVVDEDEVRNLPAVRASEAMVARGELTVDEVVQQKEKITQIMERVMKRDVHYGVIPGVGKPSLLKPGAEAINVALRLAPHYDSEKIWHDDGHLTVVSKCTLKHIPTDLTIATGEGLCTTRETRYAFRNAKRKCPSCGAEAIIKGKAEYGGGWVCWKKEGGCGTNFNDGDPAIEEQEQGKIANPDIADTYNTVLKMADKRALTAAVLNGTAASDVFTQDVEDSPQASGAEAAVSPGPEPRPAGAPPAKREFDPGRDLLPGAITVRVQEDAIAIRQGQRDLDPNQDWPAIEQACATHVFGHGLDDLTRAETGQFWKRLANAVVKVTELAGSGDFPPPTHEQIAEGYAWAFNGAQIELRQPTTEVEE